MGRATVVAGRAEYTECWGRELGCVYADNTKAYFWGGLTFFFPQEPTSAFPPEGHVRTR